jgi:hypothetical protein
MNQGAESTLSFLLSLLAIIESYAIVDKKKATEGITSPIDLISQIAENTQPSPNMQDRLEAKEYPIEEMT